MILNHLFVCMFFELLQLIENYVQQNIIMLYLSIPNSSQVFKSFLIN
jgi:hypothetical protein